MQKRVLSFLKFPVIIALFFLSTELILRLTGYLIVPSDTGYDDISQDEDKIRILALGESTTDERFAEKMAWTNQLEKQLLNKGYKVRIYNVARVGSNSALLLSRFPDQLERYRPHIVITMMGINDTHNMLYNFESPPLKLQKLYRIASERIKSRLSCEIESVHPESMNQENTRQWLTLTAKKDLPDLEKLIRKEAKSESEVASILAVLSSNIKNRQFPYDISEFKHLMERAHKIHPRNEHNLKIMMHVLTSDKDPKCLDISKEILQCGMNLSDEFLQLVTDCHRVMKKPLSHETFDIRGLSLISGTGFTAKHYQKLAEILKSKNIKLVAMQYPTLPLENLKQNFTDQKEIVFVSNQENFSEALKTHQFREIFKDNFRATWGHTTELGHGLIANAAMKEVEPLLIGLSRK